MKGSLVIVGFFAVGVLLGRLGLVPGCLAGSGGVSFYALCALMFCVGMGVGGDTGALRSISNVDPRLLCLPLATILGTLSAVSLVSILFPCRRLADSLAVGSGFGYYSLSSVFITQYRGAELGTVALLSNIAREIATLLGAPLLARWFGKLAPIASGGATTMDTTLPVIAGVSGPGFVVLSVFHGFVVDFSVPFLVTFFCTL